MVGNEYHKAKYKTELIYYPAISWRRTTFVWAWVKQNLGCCSGQNDQLFSLLKLHNIIGPKKKEDTVQEHRWRPWRTDRVTTPIVDCIYLNKMSKGAQKLINISPKRSVLKLNNYIASSYSSISGLHSYTHVCLTNWEYLDSDPFITVCPAISF